jgi:nitrogenase molybdenum-iron protein NifN
LRETDALFEVLRELSGRATPEKHDNERQRLADAYVEAHKYLAGLRVAVYGEEDFVVALASFVSEVGAVPVICASPGRSGHLRSRIKHHLRKYDKDMTVLQNASIESFEAAVCRTKIDLLLAGSQVSAIARRHHIPHVRVGFPILDRVGGQRMLHIGYLGTLRLFDAMVNALIGHNEENAETDSR